MAPASPTCWADLAARRAEGVEFRRVWRSAPGSTLLHLAIHGGGIEPGTTELADAAAGRADHFYSLEALRSTGNAALHLTSTRFDEPKALAMVREAEHVVSWHGAGGEAPVTYLGGRDEALRDAIGQALSAAGFAVALAGSDIDASNPRNICNRNARGGGVQLEISTAQRKAFFARGDLSRANRGRRTAEFSAYVTAVTSVLPGGGTPGGR
ncbi:poly-gamma-glutamate hydrolase family protein [Streptomyces sp. PTM05]|uniref:Poly-gamma-glutamate hydrolase family protein n=1 Tax=Streptantibioticus parmotrematis TaxID=2873249 RepID=A0ABS7QKX6_9ACTN|nr:poly-gamma-glutamate hydrolase family protein [Streptantibioticus parmotrematis]MBY8883593.1 poly-gamma-glutamate hydrolase family protein [Streptantibioticus parmotrematis]